MPYDMERVETELTARASATGVEIRWGMGVEGVDQSDEDATVWAGGKTFRGRWLVGCDGGRSTVRKSGGFEFVGTDPEFTGYSVQAEMADPGKLDAAAPAQLQSAHALVRRRESNRYESSLPAVGLRRGKHSLHPRARTVPLPRWNFRQGQLDHPGPES